LGQKIGTCAFPFNKKYFVKKKYGNLVALTFYSSPITFFIFSHSHFRFPLWFFLLSFHLFIYFLLFCA
jgi:hypothetical protein